MFLACKIYIKQLGIFFALENSKPNRDYECCDLVQYSDCVSGVRSKVRRNRNVMQQWFHIFLKKKIDEKNLEVSLELYIF